MSISSPLPISIIFSLHLSCIMSENFNQEIVTSNKGMNYAECGKSNTSIEGDWPWMASLGVDEMYSSACAATLISDKWLLTAAHCASSWRLTTARLGDLKLPNATPSNELIEEVILHPNYTTKHRPKSNDIALVKLKNSVAFTRHIRPICLPDKNENITNNSDYSYNQQESFAMQWMIYGISEDRITQLLHATNVTIVNSTSCAKSYQRFEKYGLVIRIDDSMLCARTDDDEQQLHREPLMFLNKDTNDFFIGGIMLLAAYFCGGPDDIIIYDTPVYTKVAHFMDWIRETTGLK